MKTKDILAEVNAEIDRLRQVRALLAGKDTATRRSAARRPTHVLSAAGRARILAAQRARWAKARRAPKKEAHAAAANRSRRTQGGEKAAPQNKPSAARKPPAAPPAPATLSPIPAPSAPDA